MPRSDALRTPAACLLHLLSDITAERPNGRLSETQKAGLDSLKEDVEARFLKTDQRTAEGVKSFLGHAGMQLSRLGLNELALLAARLSSDVVSAGHDQTRFIALYNDDLSMRVFETMIAKAILDAMPKRLCRASAHLASYLTDALDAIDCDDATEHGRANAQRLRECKKGFIGEWRFGNAAADRGGDLDSVRNGIANPDRTDAADIRLDLKTCLRAPFDSRQKLLLIPYFAITLPFFFTDATRSDGSTKLFPWKKRSEEIITSLLRPARVRTANFNNSTHAKQPTPVHGVTLDHQPPAWIEEGLYSVAARRFMRLETRPEHRPGHASLQENQLLHGLPTVCDISGSVLDELHIAAELKKASNDVNVQDILTLAVVNCIYTGSHSCQELLTSAHFLNAPLKLELTGLGSSSDANHEEFEQLFHKGINEGDPMAAHLAVDMIKNSDFVANYQSFFEPYQNETRAAMTGTIQYLKEHSRFFRHGSP